jgi:hypothetical protein
MTRSGIGESQNADARKFATSKAAKEAHWHSRRHETREAQDQARKRYQAARGKDARRRRAEDRQK